VRKEVGEPKLETTTGKCDPNRGEKKIPELRREEKRKELSELQRKQRTKP
jgi:hypothetical protein